MKVFDPTLAQLVEHMTVVVSKNSNHVVAGSIPASRNKLDNNIY